VRGGIGRWVNGGGDRGGSEWGEREGRVVGG